MAEPLITGVADTAFMVAAWRARETERPDALFRDPLAGRLAGERGQAIAASVRGGLGGWQVTIRTVIIDDMVQAAVAAGADTILNLGAGLDARPYRLPLPASLRWIEVDYPHVIDWKADRLAGETARCRLDRVKLDLADLPARRRLFAEIAASSAKTLVLTEGVIPYLAVDAVGALADDLKALREPAWIVDYFSPAVMRHRRRVAARGQMRQAPFLFQPPDWHAFFAQHGWSPAETRYLSDVAARLGRPLPLPRWRRTLIRLRRLFTPRARRGELRKFAGYVLLRPTGAGG
jgi:methyltransferase (TIGR00027 family)